MTSLNASNTYLTNRNTIHNCELAKLQDGFETLRASVEKLIEVIVKEYEDRRKRYEQVSDQAHPLSAHFEAQINRWRVTFSSIVSNWSLYIRQKPGQKQGLGHYKSAMEALQNLFEEIKSAYAAAQPHFDEFLSRTGPVFQTRQGTITEMAHEGPGQTANELIDKQEHSDQVNGVLTVPAKAITTIRNAYPLPNESAHS